MLPGKSAKQNRDLVALFRGEGALDWAVEMLGRIKTSNLAQPHALCLQALPDFRIVRNLDEIRRHKVLRRPEFWCG
jgi:hypothetical protein